MRTEYTLENVKGMMALIVRGQLRKLRSITFAAAYMTPDDIHALMQNCPLLKHFTIDAEYELFVCCAALGALSCVLHCAHCCVCFITRVICAH